MYQALYRKWRPRTFSDVVGQEHITETLRRQCAQGRPGHAYLFTGTRGTGKTTCAKILAKAVNCRHLADGDPCNECDICRGVDDGSLLDVLEIDAASNNGVDSVRALRDEAVYTPASARYRVYIIDEVHMLSTPAFNALLKILEEPPAHLIFILATTELHKVPATILSRCQRFAFKRLQPRDIEGRLKYVSEQEGMDVTPDACELLSRLADGALRDALSLLDQCAAGGGTVDAARVTDVLGLAGNLETVELMDCVLRRDAQAALLQMDRLYSGGRDVSALLNQLSGLTRDLLVRMTAPEGGAALLTGGYDASAMDRLSRGVSPRRLLYMASRLQSTAAALPQSANRRTDAELCLLRLCDESLCGDVEALSARVSRLEEGAPLAAPVPQPATEPPAEPARRSAPAPKGRDGDPPPWEESPPGPAPKQESEPEQGPAPEPEAKPEAKPAPAPKGGGFWDALAEDCRDSLSPMYRSVLDTASGALEGDVLVVSCADDFTRETLDRDAVKEVLRDAAGKRLGRAVGVRVVLATGEKKPADRLDELIRRGSRYEGFSVK